MVDRFRDLPKQTHGSGVFGWSVAEHIAPQIVDRREILTIEKIDDSKDNFLDAIGTATYSNSKPTVSSYVSIFESLWQQTRSYTHIREVNVMVIRAYFTNVK